MAEKDSKSDEAVKPRSRGAEQLPLQSADKSVVPAPARVKKRQAAKPSRKARRPATVTEDAGAELERRVARVEFAEGAFVRLRTPIRAEADPGRDVLTDIDVLSIDVDLRLHVTRSALECKSGGGQAGEPDRLFWLAGFKQYLGLERAVLVRETTSRRGLALARRIDLHVLGFQTLVAREAANAWLPDRFAHIGGEACQEAETRTDTQLRAIAAIPADLVAFLRHGAPLADSHEILGAVSALGGAVSQAAVLPEPAGLVVAGHALVAVLLAALQDAGRSETMADEDLRRRIELSLVTGSPDDTYVLDVLAQADELLRAQSERIHAAYVEQGAKRLNIDFPNLRELVSKPPPWVDRYIDFLARLRSNPTVARDLLQTAELAVFDGLAGGHAWQAEAFNRLFTPEHWSLISSALRLLRDIAGLTLGDRLSRLKDLNFDRAAPAVPDRRQSASRDADPQPVLAQEEEMATEKDAD